jgi:hypothetical protein
MDALLKGHIEAILRRASEQAIVPAASGLVAAVLVCVLFPPAFVFAAGRGIDIAQAPPAESGKMRVQIALTDAKLEADLVGAPVEAFKVIVGKGEARVLSVKRLLDAGERRHTVLAFDQSGSFAPYWDNAFELARAFAYPRPDSTVHLITFGLRLDDRGAVAASDAESLLAKVRQERPGQAATRLKSFLHDAVKLASDRQPLSNGGVREVVVFTDGGEESSTYKVKDLAAEARSLGVRLHTVVFYQPGNGSGGIAQRLDDMKRLAELTGGVSIQVSQIDQARKAMSRLEQSIETLFWMDVAFCGLPSGSAFLEDSLSVETHLGGTRVGWSDAVPFRQHASGAALAPCNRPCVPACPTGSACVAGVCQVKEKRKPDLPAPSVATAAPPENTKEGFPWATVAIALFVLLLMVLLFRKKERPVEAAAGLPPVGPTPSPPIAAPAAAEIPIPVGAVDPVASSAPGPVWQDPFVVLPDTRLVLVPARAGHEPFYRITKSSFTVGASTGEVDLALEVQELSGRHATFQLFKAGNVFVMDELSTNGTFIDGRRLLPGERAQVKPGQIIHLSKKLALRLEQPGASAEPVAPPPGVPMVAQGPAADPAPLEPSDRPKARTVYAPIKPGGKDG